MFWKVHGLAFTTHLVRASNSSWARRYRSSKSDEFSKNPKNPKIRRIFWWPPLREICQNCSPLKFSGVIFFCSRYPPPRFETEFWVAECVCRTKIHDQKNCVYRNRILKMIFRFRLSPTLLKTEWKPWISMIWLVFDRKCRWGSQEKIIKIKISVKYIFLSWINVILARC